MKGFTTCLWFDDQAEEAAEFYVSVFKGSKITGKSYYTKAGPGPDGSVQTVQFRLAGMDFLGLNGGPVFKFTPAISVVVNCEDQKEIDRYWEKLSEGGEKGDCGWLTDKFGLSWQITPTIIEELMSDSDPKKVERVTRAMLQMKKLDIAKLKKAYEE